jgi:serine protease Do
MIRLLLLACLGWGAVVAPRVALASPLAQVGGEIARIDIEGNRRIEEPTIRATLGAHRGDALTPSRIRAMIRGVHATGFFDDVQIYLAPDESGRGVVVTVRVIEKPAVRDVQILGAKKVKEEDVREAMSLRTFTVLNDNDLKRNVRLIRQKYVEKGYYLAEVEPVIAPFGDDQVDVTLKITENRKVVDSIQAALQGALPAARAATVAVEIKGGAGSGVIVSPDGLILTAAHVSMAVNKKLTVIMEDGSRHEALTLGLVADTDAAMMRITEEGTYPFVEMDRGNGTRLGDWVFALGHSGGFDQERGLVVRLGRLVRIANNTVQSDCTLIGGDSGGPLFDLHGKLIAIHSRVGANLQVNNHVPVRTYLDNWDAMLEAEFIGDGPFAARPQKGGGLLGVATEPSEGGGLIVTKVGRKTSASDAGITEGDVMISINDVRLDSKDRLKQLLKEMAPGDEVVLVIERAGESETLTFELGER